MLDSDRAVICRPIYVQPIDLNRVAELQKMSKVVPVEVEQTVATTHHVTASTACPGVLAAPLVVRCDSCLPPHILFPIFLSFCGFCTDFQIYWPHRWHSIDIEGQ